MVDGRRCSICGHDDADILCSKCRCFVCENCYNEQEDACVRCSPLTKRSIPVKSIRMPIGLAMVLLGLSIAASALVASVAGDEGVIVVFPFIIGNMSGWIAGLYSFVFFIVIVSASILPWYIHTRAEANYGTDNDLIIHQWSNVRGGEEYKSVEYMITTELPQRLHNTMNIESDEETIYIRSSIDKSFNRSYPIPEGFDLEGIDYDYEEEYLILKLLLVKVD